MDNTTIVKQLLNHAADLERIGNHLYRVRAYRRVASVVAMLPRPVEELVDEGGRNALAKLPGVGTHLAATLEGLVREGRLRTLGPKPEQPVGEERVLGLPGVGTATALRLREELGVESVDEVECAAEAGMLDRVGVGAKRLRGIKAVLRERRERQRQAIPATHEPTVDELLSVDEEFRAMAGNAAGRGAGAPVLQTARGSWTIRASFSSNPLAYRLGREYDWVEIHFRNGEESGERIVVTERLGPANGKRVIRGRERECNACWAS